ncbi:MAG: cytochrome c551 [Bacillus sp. (in: firmicutes)]
MNKKLLAVLIGTMLTLAACGGDDTGGKTDNGDAVTTADAGREEKLYNNKCASCHGENLEGAFGPALESVGSSMTQEEIEAIIEEGKGGMPPRLLEGDDAANVAAWLAEKK